MSGTVDTAGAPVLMVAYNGEPCVRLYQLPEFSSRGVLTPVSVNHSSIVDDCSCCPPRLCMLHFRMRYMKRKLPREVIRDVDMQACRVYL